jgi:tetratricopeptide (TPR) repeat protein
MEALEKLWKQLSEALGVPALVLAATAFIVVQFVSALPAVTGNGFVVALPGVLLFSLAVFSALGNVIRSHYQVDVQCALRQAALAAAAGAVAGALVHAVQLKPFDRLADGFALYVTLGWPLAACYGFVLALLDPPPLAATTSGATAPEAGRVSPERFDWRARGTAVVVFLAAIVLPPAVVVARYAVQLPASYVSAESILVGLAFFLVLKAWLRLRGEASPRRAQDGADGRPGREPGHAARRLILLVTTLLGTGLLVWKAKEGLLPSMPLAFSPAEAIPLSVVTVSVMLVWSTLAYLLAVAGPSRWLRRAQGVVALLLVLALPLLLYASVPGSDEAGQRACEATAADVPLGLARAPIPAVARATARERAATGFEEQRRWEAAEQALREAIEIRSGAGDGQGEALAESRRRLAWNLTRRGAYAEAETLRCLVVAARRHAFRTRPSPGREMALLGSQRELVSSVVDQEHWERAEKLVREVRDRFRRTDLPALSRAALTLRYTAADDRERVTEYARYLALAGRVWQERHRNALAEEALKKAMQITILLERRLERPEMDVAGTIHARLGRVYFSTGRLGEADVEFHRALAANPGPIVAGVVKAYIGDLRLVERRVDAAEVAYREAKRILDAEVGPDHPYQVLVLPGLARVMSARGDHERALAIAARAESISVRVYGGDSRRAAAVRGDCGEIFAASGRDRRGDGGTAGARFEKAVGVAAPADVHRGCAGISTAPAASGSAARRRSLPGSG